MEIGTDELEEFDDIDDVISDDTESIQTDQVDTVQEDNTQEDTVSKDEDDFIVALLKSRGIEDKSKIKFENDEGDIEELNWDNLDNNEKLNILQSSQEDPDTDLDELEIQLINAIRESGLSPSEYMQNYLQKGIDNYLQNNTDNYQYEVDQFSDDELFLYDFMSRMGNVTKEEAQEALEKAKLNETLFNKQISAIRNEYKLAEQEGIKQAQLEQEAQEQEQFEQFTNQIAEQIDNFEDFSGYDINMDEEDKQMLYDFITGVDGAGNNYFAKALSDPKILVQTAWFTLNGQQILNDITEYFQKEISNVRKESYQKGLSDAKNNTNKKPDVIFTNKQKESNQEVYNDLDDF